MFFWQAGMPTNYDCTVECDNGQRILDVKRVCGGSFCFLCSERWNISQEKLTTCINCFNSKEVETTDPEKYAEAAKNVEAASVDISEATINNMKVNGLKGGIKSRRLLHIGSKTELQDRLIRAIKYKVPISGVVENTKNKYGRPKDGIPKDARPKKNTNQLSEK